VTVRAIDTNDTWDNSAALITPFDVNVPPDTSAPITPSTPTALNITTSTFTLSWPATSDNVGVTGYEVYKDGASVNTTSSTSMPITGLNPSTTYQMKVRARDAAGNWSDFSTELPVTTATPPDTTAPSVPSGLTASSITETSFTLGWLASTDAVGVTAYEVQRGGVSLGTLTGTPPGTSMPISGLSAGTTYQMSVRARDAAGNWSAWGALSVTTNNPPPPPPPTYTLTTGASPGVGGWTAGGGSYTSGTTVQVTANPADGYVFLGWSGALSGKTNPATLTITSNTSVTANFIPVVQGGGTIPVTLSVMSNGPGNVTLTTNGHSETFTFTGNADEWLKPSSSSNGGFGWTLVNAELGTAIPVTATSSNSFVVTASVNAEIARNLNATVELNGYLTGSIQSSDIGTGGGTFTLKAVANGQVPFAAIDTSRLEVNRMLTFGMGGSRSGRTAGRVVLYVPGWIYGAGGVSMDVIDGPAEMNRWFSDPTHFQAQVPEGYIDVNRTVSTTTITYYGPGTATYNSTSGYNSFSGTPLATYVVEGNIGPPSDGTEGTGKITRTIGGIITELEFASQSTYTQSAEQTSTSGTTTVITRHDTYDSIGKFWTWHRQGYARTGLTVVEGTTARTGVKFDNNPMNFQYDNAVVKITRRLGAATTDAVGSYEELSFTVGDRALTGPHSVSRGQGTDSHADASSGYGDYANAIRSTSTSNSTGGGTSTEYFSASATGFSTNLAATDPVLAIGQPKSTRTSFLDGALNTSSDLITTFTYKANLIDSKPVVATAITKQGTVTTGSVSYAYTEGTFTDTNPTTTYPMVTTVATAHANGSDTLVTTIKSYSVRISNLDRRGKPISVANPDGTQISYAYVAGYYDTTTHSWSASKPGTGETPDLLVAELHGKKNAAGTVTTYATGTVDPLDMDPNRSTVVERIFDSKGQLRREATYVYTGGAMFTPLSVIWSDYDGLGHLTQKKDSSGVVLYGASYTGLHKDSETDEQNVTTTYDYDNYEHIQTATRPDATFNSTTVPGATVTYAYDEIGRLKTETVGSGAETLVTSYTYDTADRPHTRTLPGGFKTTLSYPLTTGNYSAETDTTLPGNGTKNELLYADGRIHSVKGTAVPDVTTAYSIDGTTGYLVTTTTPTDGPTTVTTTDWLGRVTSIATDTWSGGTRTVSNTYNSSGQLVQQDTTKSGGIRLAPAHLYHYDEYGRMDLEGFSANGGTSISPTTDYGVKQYESKYQTGALTDTAHVYRYDAVRVWPYDGTNASTSRLASETFTQITGLSATTAAHVVSIDLDRNSSETTATIDTTNHTTTTSAALGLASTSTTSTTDANGNATITSSTTITALGPTIIAVNANGLDVSSTSAQNLTVTQTYDSLRRLNTTTDPRIGSTTYAYVSGSNLAQTVTGPDSRVSTLGYDSAGRVNSKKDDAGKYAYFKYDDAGNLTYQWGDTVNPISYEYNDSNQRTKMHTYRSGTWTGATFPSGFSGTGDVTTWTYKAGLLDKKTDNSNAATSYEYNELGQITKRTDARNWETTYGYFDSTDNRLQSVVYPSGSGTTNLGYTYTRSGQVKTVSDASGTRTFAYYDSGTNANGVTTANPDGVSDDTDLLNKSGRLKSETLDSSWYSGHTLTYTYNYGASNKANGSLSALSLNTATAYGVTYDYDSVLRLNKITYNTSNAFNYAYVANSNLIDTVKRGTSDYLDYDYETTGNRLSTVKASWGGLYQVETRVSRDPHLPLINSEKTNGSEYLTAIGRGALSGVATDFSYTDRYEVTSSGKYEMASDWTVATNAPLLAGTALSYHFDAIGNRSASSPSPVWTPNALNQYTATPSSSSYGYDANGNMTSDGTWDYNYDAENRLISVETSASLTRTSSSRKYLFTYDYLGRRIKKETRGGWDGSTYASSLANTKFLYDGWNLIAELNGSATVTRRFVWGLDASGSLQGAGGVGGLLQIDADSVNEYYPVYDASFNVLALYNQNGSIASGAAYEYDPFGKLQTVSSGTYADANPFRSATKYTDTETGLVYYGHRFYSPWLGRFVNRDPIEEQGGPNLYAFCGNDGVNRYDVLGMGDDPVKLDPFISSAPRSRVDEAQSASEKEQAIRDTNNQHEAERASELARTNTAIAKFGISGWLFHGGSGDADVDEAGRLAYIKVLLDAAFAPNSGTNYRSGWWRDPFPGIGNARLPNTSDFAELGREAKKQFTRALLQGGIFKEWAGAARDIKARPGEFVEESIMMYVFHKMSGGSIRGMLRGMLPGNPRVRGNVREDAVLERFGFQKNGTTVSTAEGDAIPDALEQTLSVEIKDTKVVSATQQIRIETDAARAAGQDTMLITGANTRISGPARDRFDVIIRLLGLGPEDK
jgi:RHS repeat-associated protein